MTASVLPKYYRLPGPGPVKFLWVPGFSGHPWITAALSRTPGEIRPESMFGFIRDTGDTLVTVAGPGELGAPARDAYFEALLREINGPTIAVGLSTGAAVVNELYRRAVAAGKDRHLCVVLASAPASLASLRRRFGAIVRLAARPHLRLLDDALAQILWLFCLRPTDFVRLYRRHMLWVVPLLRDSVRASRNMLSNLQLFMAQTGFGPPQAARGHVLALNLQTDDVIRLDETLAALRRAYTDFSDRNLFSYLGSHHGLVEVDGRATAAALLQIREYCLRVFASTS